jgi:hypothetical protein
MDQSETLEADAGLAKFGSRKQRLITAGFLVAVTVAMTGWLIAIGWAVTRFAEMLFF